MIGYYIHHHGSGHLNRAVGICTQLGVPVTALTSLPVPEPHPFAAVVTLPRDDEASTAEHTGNGALHWVPHHQRGLSDRMARIAQWVADERPDAVVVDVSVEVAVFTRLLGVPVIVMAVPGERTDDPHRLVHQLADHIVAAWPRELYEPSWLRPYRSKTSYVGGISRFDGRVRQPCAPADRPTVLVLGGAGGTGLDTAAVRTWAAQVPEVEWTTLGVSGGPWSADPWPDICAADVVVTHAGQGCVADIATAARPAVIVPQRRPFGEQLATADTLRRHRLAEVAEGWPNPESWPDLLATARANDVGKWGLWQTAGAAGRAADAIVGALDQCAVRIA